MPIVALGDRYTKSVVFIAGAAKSAGEAKLRGTGFVIGIQADAPHAFFLYVVTAAHVVRSCAATFVRITNADGSVEDMPVDRWVYHPTEDVAVTPFHDPTGQFAHTFVEDYQFVGSGVMEQSPAAGDDVYFVGLLGNVPSMGKRNVPMVRSGSIGALNQAGIPMRLPDDTVVTVTGHLIDCRSFGGFSGSPCFVRYISGEGKTERMGLRFPIQSTQLLGMVAGHFDLKASVVLPDQENKLKVPVAAGIAVLSSAETIMETLNDEVLVKERDEDNAHSKERANEQEQDHAATADALDEASEFQRFENLTRKLVQTPKPKKDKES
jgi:hypothetical protein